MMQYQTRRKAVVPAVQESPVQAGQRAGMMVPSAETLGRPVDLPGAIREKMEASFGADLSGVQLYESQAVADAGAEAMAMGSKIGFAPGKLDFASADGQALLGHEISHVVSQARGEVTGSGFLNDHALEARADREGEMAAAGESVYSGPVTPISSSSTLQAAGPIQAKKKSKEEKRIEEIQNMEISAPRNAHRENYVKQRNDGSYAAQFPGKDANDIQGYVSPEAAALGMLMKGKSDEELEKDENLQNAFMGQYKKDTAKRLEKSGTSALQYEIVNGEQADYNRMLKANATEDLIRPMAITNAQLTGSALDKAGDYIQQNGKLKKLLSGGADALMGSKEFGDNRKKATDNVLERFATNTLSGSLHDLDKEIRERQARQNLEPGASDKQLKKEMESIGRLNPGTLAANILDRFRYAEEGKKALDNGEREIKNEDGRPIKAQIFEAGDRFRDSLD